MLKKLRERLFRSPMEEKICMLLKSDPYDRVEGYNRYRHKKSGIEIWCYGINRSLLSPSKITFPLYYILKIDSLIRRCKRLNVERLIDNINLDS